ncbi:MAG: hypothetical protein ACLFTG_05095, partial [Alphaproteobacteria bacterium]
WLARHLHRAARGALALDLEAWERASPDLAAEVLARTVATVGAAPRPLGRGRVAAVVRRLRAGEPRLTFGGAILGRAGAQLIVAAEDPSAVRAAAPEARRPPLVGAPFDGSPVVTDAAILIC